MPPALMVSISRMALPLEHAFFNSAARTVVLSISGTTSACHMRLNSGQSLLSPVKEGISRFFRLSTFCRGVEGSTGVIDRLYSSIVDLNRSDWEARYLSGARPLTSLSVTETECSSHEVSNSSQRSRNSRKELSRLETSSGTDSIPKSAPFFSLLAATVTALFAAVLFTFTASHAAGEEGSSPVGGILLRPHCTGRTTPSDCRGL